MKYYYFVYKLSTSFHYEYITKNVSLLYLERYIIAFHKDDLSSLKIIYKKI